MIIDKSKLPPSVRDFGLEAEEVWPKRVKPNPLNRLDQISILVKDVRAAIDYFGEAFGLAPFYLVDIHDQGLHEGVMSQYHLQIAFCEINDGIELELIQHISGNTPHVVHLREQGEGLFHLRFISDDIEADLEYLKTLGIDAIWDYEIAGKKVNAYLNSHIRFGVRSELVRPTEQLLKYVSKRAASGEKEQPELYKFT